MNCAHCNKLISGKRVIHSPPVLHIQLGIDSVREYHLNCYREIADTTSEELDECGDLEDRLEHALRSHV